AVDDFVQHVRDAAADAAGARFASNGEIPPVHCLQYAQEFRSVDASRFGIAVRRLLRPSCPPALSALVYLLRCRNYIACRVRVIVPGQIDLLSLIVWHLV